MALRWVNNTFNVFSLLLLHLPKWELQAAGVTLITHGFSGNVTDWIIPMAGKIPQYYRFPGTNFSCYEIYFTQDIQGNYRRPRIWRFGIPSQRTLFLETRGVS